MVPGVRNVGLYQLRSGQKHIGELGGQDRALYVVTTVEVWFIFSGSVQLKLFAGMSLWLNLGCC